MERRELGEVNGEGGAGKGKKKKKRVSFLKKEKIERKVFMRIQRLSVLFTIIITAPNKVGI